MNDIQKLIDLTSEIKSTEDTIKYFTMINNIYGYIISKDIYNGRKYLAKVMKYNDIVKNVRMMSPEEQDRYNRLQTSQKFLGDCKGVLFGITKTIYQDKFKDKLNNQLPQNIKTLNELVDLFKDKLKED